MKNNGSVAHLQIFSVSLGESKRVTRVPFFYFLKVERLSFNGQRWKPCCIYEIGQKKVAVAQADLSDLSFIDSLFQKRL